MTQPRPNPHRKGGAKSKSTKSEPGAKGTGPINRPQSERLGEMIAGAISRYIARHKGKYLRDEAENYNVVLDGRRIVLNYAQDNYALAKLMLDATTFTTTALAARAAIQRLQVHALGSAGNMQLRRYSAMSSDGTRLYIPLATGKLLQITADGVEDVSNGENTDCLWLEHPNGEPLDYTAGADVSAGLSNFERLLVDTQACSIPWMKWFVAMNAGLFPYVRDSCQARFLMEFIGSTQQGKTSGAKRFTLLNGLGDVKGDYSVAALRSIGDIGLLVLDNKEQANFAQELIDHCLFLSTGAEPGRATVEGALRTIQKSRPVGIITTIEGVSKAELQARCVEVQYVLPGPNIRRGPIEQEISKLRHQIGSAIIPVLQRYMRIRNENRPTPNPIPQFEEHFTVLCNLLRAYGEEAGRPTEWAENLINEWTLTLTSTEPDEDDLENPILQVLNNHLHDHNQWIDTELTDDSFTYDGAEGKLYVSDPGHFLALLQKLNLKNLSLPKTANGLSKRLKSCKFQSLRFLPTDTPGVLKLKRTSQRRPIGFFLPQGE